MKKFRNVFWGMVLIVSMLSLQGCSYSELTTPVTSHEVTVEETNTNTWALRVELNADLTQNYAWYVYATKEIDEAENKVHKGLLNNTFTNKYKYIVRDDGEFDFYLVLVKDSNLETARIYPYKMKVTVADGLTFEEMAAYNLNTDKKLMKTLSETLDLTETQ